MDWVAISVCPAKFRNRKLGNVRSERAAEDKRSPLAGVMMDLWISWLSHGFDMERIDSKTEV
ncbi:uncharacterized protein N7506_009827 [Penicillium brevicompactum]|uniref:uncharacterized protein n=1 Tax=Penicillium brevicompactum TaxID=5074 RepID=UPI002542374D|nr:uncharacterized protein N7506_009827 [Penicillium brevicompactum]KAJ5326725.1 hypothetical protein N7506_009827 [Penicillium brevicompactum]